MSIIRAFTEIDAPRASVWDALSELESHDRWMSEAISVDFIGAQRRGVGTQFVCPTKVGPLRTNDRMTITGWDEGTSISVRHEGIVTGVGTLRMIDTNDRIRVEWVEELRLPLAFGGRIGDFFAAKLLSAIWTRNLDNLRRLVERSPATRV